MRMASYTVMKPSFQRDYPQNPVTQADIQNVLQYGYVVLEQVFSINEAEEAKAEIQRLNGLTPKVGRNRFEGFKTNRIYALLNK